MPKSYAAPLLLITLLACASCAHHSVPEARQGCPLPSPTIIKDEGDVLFQYWELGEDIGAYASTRFSVPEALQRHQRLLSARYDTRPEALLERGLEREAPGDRANNQLLLNHKHLIRSMSCLEAELLSLQNSRADLIARPTEFIALSLSKQGRHRLLYFTSNTPGVRQLGTLHERIARWTQDGWTLDWNLHNHNFFITEDNYRGAVAPSVTDAWLYQTQAREFGLREARITNGSHTVALPAALFDALATTQDDAPSSSAP